MHSSEGLSACLRQLSAFPRSHEGVVYDTTVDPFPQNSNLGTLRVTILSTTQCLTSADNDCVSQFTVRVRGRPSPKRVPRLPPAGDSPLHPTQWRGGLGAGVGVLARHSANSSAICDRRRGGHQAVRVSCEIGDPLVYPRLGRALHCRLAER